jgi:hypothetical protein
MSFEFRGLTGLLLQDNSNVAYSLVSVGSSIPEHSGIPNVLLQICISAFIIFSFL